MVYKNVETTCFLSNINFEAYLQFLICKISFLLFLSQLLIKMSSLSLDASIRTCRVDTGEATRIESDRFLNPNNMICIPWNGTNNKGQQVCADSFYTKRRGCNSAMDRVSVENDLRPQYADYIGLNIAGLKGKMYGTKMSQYDSDGANKYDQSRHKYTGSFGNQFQSSNIGSCGINSYNNAMAQMAQANRQTASANNGRHASHQKRQLSGTYGY